MAYKDEQGGHDNSKTTDGLHLYDGQEPEKAPDVHVSETEMTETTAEQITEGKQTRKPKEGLLTRARKALFGDRDKNKNTKSGEAAVPGGTGGLEKTLAKIATPKRLTALVMGTGLGVFSVLGIFTSYKNDGMIRNDNPLRCEQGVVELPEVQGSGSDNDVQETVNIMYDIFVNQFGYTEHDLVGMVACMLVETGCNPDRLESDFILTAEKEQFDAVAGPGTNPTSDVAQNAYWLYGESFASGGGWNGNTFYYVDGKMCPGIGLIQWTAGRANNFIQGLDKVSLDVSPMDVHYQCAYLIAEAQTSYPAWAPGGERTGNSDSTTATTNFFGTMVYGHMPSAGDSHLAERLSRIQEAESYVFAAAANSEFTMDAVTMAEELAEEGFNSSVAEAQTIQFCVNNTFIVNADIAHAAVSISFLERGDYEDVNGAYGSYRRAARSPNMINDWDFLDGQNTDVSSLGEPNQNITYADAGRGTGGPKDSWRFYSDEMGNGTLDLIACTEYYYFAHMIAFPKETGNAGSAGYFSSCDRGTATAVRIAGADDKFPAGNPLYQLNWATGAAKQGSEHNENARGTQGKGFLWKFSGFMRGSDWYSATGSPSISNGTVMISWNERAANDLLGENAGGATESESGSGMLAPDDSSLSDDGSDTGYAGKSEAVKLAGLRWPKSISNSTRHIITYVGDATVQDFWGLDWLYQQWQLFDDADRLIHKDLTETVPEVMQKGLALKASYAKKSSDQHMTFYKAKAMGAETNDDLTAFEPANGRLMEFNSKTGLPEFHAWEQIYTRLIHNSDDDAAAGSASGDNLFEKATSFQKDGYLDDVETEEVDAKIEQYDSEQTVGNKHFFNDWNSLGVSLHKFNVNKSDHTNDYKDPAADGGGEQNLIWYDKTDGNVIENWTHANGATASPYWRYELVTDIEYRQNQFLRFGLASLMCSYPSEEDANVYQAGGEGNISGHIMGNLYRRYSKISDKVDNSGRYYYYNTVVSNDMLQDLVQLYTEERNTYTDGDTYVADGATGAKGKDERNYGPMYLESLGRVYATSRYKTTGSSANWVDRRYGLTADDIAYIAGGIEGNKMGEADADEVKTAFSHILTEPMHMMTAAQLSLYDNTKNSRAEAVDSAHEGTHLFNELDADGGSANPYETEIYGMNPFLMLESSRLLGLADGSAGESGTGMADGTAAGSGGTGEMSAGAVDWEAGYKTGKSVRNDIEAELTGVSGGSGTKAKGIDPTDASGTSDDRLAWIDRHYFVTENGGIGTFAYQVLGLQPSTGSKSSSAAYENNLRNVKTLDAGHEGQSNTDNLFGSKGLVQYSDFIYADNSTDNKQMAKRLFGKDDRNKDGATQVDGARDDYNRRDFILIPYYHTHSQQCDHSDLIGFGHYDLKCRWQNNNKNPSVADNMTLTSTAMIDTQVALNGQDGTYRQEWHHTSLVKTCSHTYDDSTDYGDTVSFNTTHVKNRGKYDMNQVLASIDNQSVRYFADTGDEILWNAKPYIHVTCDGWTQSNPCTPGDSCSECYCDGDDDHSAHPNCTCTGDSNCTNTICHACGDEIKCGDTHTHPCVDCLAFNWCHDHKECDDYGRTSSVPIMCSCPNDPGMSHHEDGGTVNFSYQSDKCHYEYGCNALEYLYHNTESGSVDGSRMHYRLKNHADHTPQTMYDPGSMELYQVNAVYMVIPTSPDVNMGEFDIRDYIGTTQFNASTNLYAGGQNSNTRNWTPDGYPWSNNAVKPDKCNLVQQVSYDGNGWVDYNWQTMIKLDTEGSFMSPKTDGEYYGAVLSSAASMEKHDDHGGSAAKPAIGHPALQSGVTYTNGSNGNYSYGSMDGILQYFTIEGDVIHRESDWEGYIAKVKAVSPTGKEQSEFTANIDMNGTEDDLKALESIRNRVGYGKQLNGQSISLTETYTVSQANGPGARGSSQEPIRYENTWYNEDGDAASVDTGHGTGLGNHGWGEVAVTGTQHPKDLRSGGTDYGDSKNNPGVSGPDGSKGNSLCDFGPSLLREIIGDEHVVHVKFDAQDYDGLTDEDLGDNGRDFMYYVDKKRAAKEQGVEESELKPKDYQNDESGYFTDHISDFGNKGPADAGSNKYGTFKLMDMDTLYINYFTHELTDKMYTEDVYPYNATDEPFREGSSGQVPNRKNATANAVNSVVDGAVNGGDAMKKITTFKEEEKGDSTANTGDYRNWVTHASRGTRGMMTQYLNFANFFNDVYDETWSEKNNAYMCFEVVMRSDITKLEQGGTDEYGYPMGSDDADHDKDRYDPDNKDNGGIISKQEGFVYTTAPGDAVLSIDELHRAWGYGDGYAFSDTYGQGSNSHWKNMIDLYNAAMSTTRKD